MKVLKDIKCYSNLSDYCENNIESINFEGKILIDEEGWFEGIVKNIFSDKNENDFVFGICHDNNDIELIKIGNYKEVDPLLFVCHKEEDLLIGDFVSLSLFNDETYGRFSMNLDEADYFYGNKTRFIDKEKEELEEAITKYKDNNKEYELYKEAYNKKILLAYKLFNKIDKNTSVLLSASNDKKLVLKQKSMFEDDLR